MQLKYVKTSKEKRMRYGNLNKDLISYLIVFTSIYMNFT